VGQSAQHEVVGVEIFWPLALDAFDLGRAQTWLDCTDRAQGDLVLQCENVVERTVVVLGPDIRAAYALDELRRPEYGAQPFPPAARVAGKSG
jgi:hypothetical protein